MPDEFERLTAQSEVDLARAALLIARDEYPELSVDGYLARLEAYADRVRSRLPRRADEERRIAELNTLLFEELGFRGDHKDFYDPRNSLLNEVMDRRRGIPVSLSILYLDIGRRLDLPLEGVCFPGHFLVRLTVPEGLVVLDPYHGGACLSEDDLEARLAELSSPPEADLEDLLAPADGREILARLLRNLCAVYLQTGQQAKALRACNRLFGLGGVRAGEYRLRASIYQALECHGAALADYRRCLDLVADGEDAEQIRGQVIRLQEAVRRMH